MTTKFSQFTAATLIRIDDIIVGLRGGNNFKFTDLSGIADTSGNRIVTWTSGGGTSVNFIDFSSNITGGAPVITSASAVDLNVALRIETQGNGNLILAPGGVGLVSITGNGAVIIPSGTDLQRPSVPSGGMVRVSTTSGFLEWWDPVAAAWVDAANTGGVVATVVGTANEIDVDSTDPQNPVLSLSSTLVAPGTVTLNANPVTSLEAATKQYVDAKQFKDSCIAGSTAALAFTSYDNGAAGVGATLTRDSNFGAITIDGVALSVGQRVLIKNQADPVENGIYTVTAVGDAFDPYILTRAVDHNTSAKMQQGVFTVVDTGNVNALTAWIQTTSVTTVGTDSVSFTEFSSSSSGGDFSITVEQTAHGFTGGEWLYLNGVAYTEAIATSVITAEVVGVVSSRIDDDFFVLQCGGIYNTSGLTAGEVSFLSDTNNGELTLTPPTAVGDVIKPQMISLNENQGLILAYRGELITANETFIEQDCSQIYTDATLTSNVYVMGLSPAISAYAAGNIITFKADAANTGAVDMNVDSIGDVDLLKNGTEELVANDILADQIVMAMYDGANFQMISQLGNAAGGGGKILQVVQTVDTTNRSVTSATYATTNITVTITPSATSSKVRITVVGAGGNLNAGAIGSELTLFRGTTELTPSGVDSMQVMYQTANSQIINFSMDFIDEPNTTSATTYSLYARASSNTIYIGRRGLDAGFEVSTIMIAEEIGA